MFFVVVFNDGKYLVSRQIVEFRSGAFRCICALFTIQIVEPKEETAAKTKYIICSVRKLKWIFTFPWPKWARHIMHKHAFMRTAVSNRINVCTNKNDAEYECKICAVKKIASAEKRKKLTYTRKLVYYHYLHFFVCLFCERVGGLLESSSPLPPPPPIISFVMFFLSLTSMIFWRCRILARLKWNWKEKYGYSFSMRRWNLYVSFANVRKGVLLVIYWIEHSF